MALKTEPESAAWYLKAAPETVSGWLVRLKWARVAVETGVLAAAMSFNSGEFPLSRLTQLLAGTSLAHAFLALRLRREQRIPPWRIAATIALDVVLLTALLELSGGPVNAFIAIYVVMIGLAGASIGVRWAYLMAGWSAICYNVLIIWHTQHPIGAHHTLADFPTQFFTIWIAFVAIAELVGHVVREASLTIAQRAAEIEEMRQMAVRTERLMSLTTLAAGAAHELSTPLATIAVASRELELVMNASQIKHPIWLSDARLIREEVQRCHLILDQMSGRAGGSASDIAEPTNVSLVFDDLRERLPPDQAERMVVRVEPGHLRVFVPRAGLVQVMLSLVKNAFDASESSRPVTLEGVQHDKLVQLIVRDEGRGISPAVLARAGEPFYTTKEPGSGTGLGLFLARMFAERCGGSLTLQSDRGTAAILELPLFSESRGMV